MGFKARRDNSINNVPVLGYNDGVDAQDVILFGACKLTETVTTSATGTIALANSIVNVSGKVVEDENEVYRDRDYSNEITIKDTTDTITYYFNNVDAAAGTMKVYSDSAKTTALANTEIHVTYYKKVPVSITDEGKLEVDGVSSGGTNGEVTVVNTSAIDVNVANTTAVPVAISSSSVSMSEVSKTNITYKKEVTIAAGASATEITLITGDNTKEKHITTICAYYDGTGATTDEAVNGWFSVLESGESTAVGWMDMKFPAAANGMLVLNLGEYGFVVPANASFRFQVNSSWTSNKMHIWACGWQPAS